ncbi:MAG: hypothetical protein EPN84_05160 [Legionella sp.]|nr:MAG: hypothetical protein EPN84_05160 [Legionella sp.]
MKNKAILVSTLLFSLSAQAHQGVQAVVSAQNQLHFTINNQSQEWLSTTSTLIPQSALNIPPYGSVIFNMDQPEQEGIQRIHYEENPGYGCDFYLNTQDISYTGTPSYATFVVPVATSSGSTCEVQTSPSVNHLIYKRTYS